MLNYITAVKPTVIYQALTDQNEASTTTGLNYLMSKLRAVAAGSRTEKAWITTSGLLPQHS